MTIYRKILYSFIVSILTISLYYGTTHASDGIIIINDEKTFIDTLSNNSDANIQLERDLNFLKFQTSKKSLIPTSFSGTIDGNGYVIKNVNNSVFSSLNGATVKNLLLDKINVSGAQSIFVNNMVNSTIENVHIINSSLHASGSNGTGALAGVMQNSTAQNITIDNTRIVGSKRTGGVIGITKGTNQLSNLNIDVYAETQSDAGGGVIGESTGPVTIDHSLFKIDFNMHKTWATAGVMGYSSNTTTANHSVIINNSSSINASVTPDVIAHGRFNGLIYEYANSPLKSQANNSTVKTTNDFSSNFFTTSLNFDEEIWMCNDTSLENLPSLKSYNQILTDYNLRTPSISDKLKTVEQFDELIKTFDVNNLSDEQRHIILQRKFVSAAGYDLINEYYTHSVELNEFIKWLYEDYENLNYYISGGRPDGSYANSLGVFNRLYHTYKEDLTNNSLTKSGVTTYGQMYQTLMTSIALTHATDVGSWIMGAWNIADENHPNNSNPIERYKIYKEMHLRSELDSSDPNYIIFDTNVFERLVVEEMRFVTNNISDDESIEWLNYYTTKKGSRNPYSYINYRFGYNYRSEKYFSAENKETWNNIYDFERFGMSLDSTSPKLWTVFEEGAVCGGISKTGSNIHGAYGAPSTVVGQPGHAAYITYKVNNAGDGTWAGIGNNISGWAQSGRTEKLHIRMPNEWGNTGFASGYQVSYILLAQEALNQFDDYNESLIKVFMADSFSEDTDKLEVYYSSLTSLDINYDAFSQIIRIYQKNNPGDEAVYQLLEKISESYAFQPKPLHDLFKQLEPLLEDQNYILKYNNLLNEVLTRASNATPSDSIEKDAVKEVSRYLLGITDTKVATFSFSGDNKNTVILSPDKFGDTHTPFDISLDGGNNWIQSTVDSNNKIVLTDDQMAQINDRNDIYVHLVGTSYEPKNYFIIDILTQGEPRSYHLNDLENKVIGHGSEKLEFLSNGQWLSLNENYPSNMDEDITLTVRTKANNHYLASPSLDYVFNKDSDTNIRKYVSIDELSIVSNSPLYKSHSAKYLIDGNLYSMFHSNQGSNRFVEIKLNEPIKLSALEYTPRQSGVNGRLIAVDIYTSMDGKNYTLSKSVTGLHNNASIKYFEFNESVETQYIKLVAKNGYANFFSGVMLSVFEDITTPAIPSIEYTTTNPTNKDVTATLSFDQENIQILNNDGQNTKVFSENGSFTFEYLDTNGTTKTIEANVSNIDKVKPTATLSYNITETTKENVIVSIIDESEEITVINNKGLKSYTFEDNGLFTFEIQDKAGNITLLNAHVDYIIENIIDTSVIEYSNLDLTKDKVIATLNLKDLEAVKILNNDGLNSYTFKDNGSFTFKYQLKNGEIHEKTATVSWIVKHEIIPSVKFSHNSPTNKDVEAKISFNHENVKIINNNGSNHYHFKENGSFTFKFINELEKIEDYTVNVDFIDKIVPSASITYQTIDNIVIAKVTDFSEKISIMNNDGKFEYKFIDNGKFTFKIKDLAGNIIELEASVDWIEKDLKPLPPIVKPETDNTLPNVGEGYVDESSGAVKPPIQENVEADSNDINKPDLDIENDKVQEKDKDIVDNKDKENNKDQEDSSSLENVKDSNNYYWIYLTIFGFVSLLSILVYYYKNKD